MIEDFNVNIKLKLIIAISIYMQHFFLILNNNIQLIDSNTFGQQYALVTTD